MIAKFQTVVNAKKAITSKKYGQENIVRINTEIYTFHEEGLQQHYVINSAVSSSDDPRIILKVHGNYKNRGHENYFLDLYILNKDFDDDAIELEGWSIKAGNKVSRDYYWNLESRSFYFFDPDGKMRENYIKSPMEGGVIEAFNKLKEYARFSKISSLKLYEEKVREANILRNLLKEEKQVRFQYWGFKASISPNDVISEIQNSIRENEFSDESELRLLDLILSYCFYCVSDFKLSLHYLALFADKTLDDRVQWLGVMRKVYEEFQSGNFQLGFRNIKFFRLRSMVFIDEEE